MESKGEANEKTGLSVFNLHKSNNIKSNNKITRRNRSFSCIGFSRGSHKSKYELFISTKIFNAIYAKLTSFSE